MNNDEIGRVADFLCMFVARAGCRKERGGGRVHTFRPSRETSGYETEGISGRDRVKQSPEIDGEL